MATYLKMEDDMVIKNLIMRRAQNTTNALSFLPNVAQKLCKTDEVSLPSQEIYC